jgi:L-proline amide hydrolase
MNTKTPMKEGFVSFRGYNTWYCIFGEKEKSGKLPLLCLHGGPGATHDYLLPLAALTANGRRLIFYDQLGGGKSDHVRGQSLWTIDLFVDELGILCRSLGLEHVHILGHSWGGQLAMEYALRQSNGLTSLILSNTTASSTLWATEANRLRSELPADVQQILQKHETANTTDSPEYQEACKVYSRRYGCLMDPLLRPDWLKEAFTKLNSNPEVYHTMWGPSEFYVTGTLKNWDLSNRLKEIQVPTLVIGGRYDEATPAITEALHRGIPGSEWIIFENSGHFPHIDETNRYLHALSKFLDRVDAQI